MPNIKKYIITDDCKKLELYPLTDKDFKKIKSSLECIGHFRAYDDTTIVPFNTYFFQNNKIIIESDYLFDPPAGKEPYEPVSAILNKNGIYPHIPTEIPIHLTETTSLIHPDQPKNYWRKLLNFF